MFKLISPQNGVTQVEESWDLSRELRVISRDQEQCVLERPVYSGRQHKCQE